MVSRRRASKPAIPAKISAPRLDDAYRRVRLFRALDQGRRRRVVWIAAPAGAGKTSVVTSYLAARRLPALWYNVDERDGDVANLFHYLATAARLAFPRRKLHLPAFKAENQSGAGAFARGFFEALYRKLPLPSVIVLDDYHEAKSELWDEVIREGIAALPTGISVIAVSRAEAPPLLSRHVASGDIALLGLDHLRLTPREMTDLVRLYRPDLRGAERRYLTPRILELANGWAAVLTLLLQNPRLDEIEASDVEQFSERLFDYFATEILDKATAAQRDFLLKTSIVPSLTTELAVQLTGSSDAARLLSDLERRSFLTQRLGTSGAYRYHPLLRGFLRRRAETDLGQAALHDLHLRAAEALVEAGQIDEAMEQFETAQGVESKIKLLLHVAPSYVAKGRGRTIETWIGRLPAARVESDGWLTYWKAASCLGHSPACARELFERAYERFAITADAAGLYLACAAAMQAIIHEGTNFARLDRWVERFESLQASGPPCPEAFLPLAATGMLMASAFRGADPSLNRKWAERAMQLASASGDVGHRVMTGGILALFFVMHADLGRAGTIVEMLRASARAADSSGLAALTLLQADALCAWARGEQEECLRLVREALSIAARTGVFVWNDYLLSLGAATTLGSDDVAAAREFLEPLARAAESGPLFTVGTYHFYAGWEASLRGDVVAALHSAELARESADALGYPFARGVVRLGLARVLWQAGRERDAMSVLQEARCGAEQVDDFLNLHGTYLIEADLVWQKDRQRALVCLRTALAIARERGYNNMFCVEASMMSRLAARALEHEIEPEHVRTIIAKRRLSPVGAPARVEGWLWRYRLRTLGSFQIQREDGGAGSPERGHDTPRGMPLRLLQAVLAFGGRGVRDTQLVDALWPDAEGDAARRVFDTTLFRLRRQLGDDGLVRLNDGRVSLNEGLCWVDIWALEHTLAEVDRQVARSAPPPILVDLAQRLLALYRGPFLADDSAGAGWVRGARERMAAPFRRAALKLGKALEKTGYFDEAAALFERVGEGERPPDSAPPSPPPEIRVRLL